MTETVHARTLIRRHAVEVLRGLPRTRENVFNGRAAALQDDQVPAIDIDTKEGGEIRGGSTGGAARYLERILTLTIAVTVKKGDGAYLDEIDTIFLEIEQALAGNNSLVVDGVAACKWVQPATEPAIDEDDAADETIARAEMQFQAYYVTAFNAPQTLR